MLISRYIFFDQLQHPLNYYFYRYNNKSYKIDDVLFHMRACDEIELRPGYRISSVDYYRNRYNIELRDPEQIMLLSRKVWVFI